MRITKTIIGVIMILLSLFLGYIVFRFIQFDTGIHTPLNYYGIIAYVLSNLAGGILYIISSKKNELDFSLIIFTLGIISLVSLILFLKIFNTLINSIALIGPISSIVFLLIGLKSIKEMGKTSNEK